MRLRVGLFAATLAGCGGAQSGSSTAEPANKKAGDGKASAAEGGQAPENQGGGAANAGDSGHGGTLGLPAVPSDLATRLGAVRDALATRLAQPKPVLTKPFATNAEHQTWVDAELEPWREAGMAVGAKVNDARPELPAPGSPESDWKAIARPRFVHIAMSTALILDEATVRASIPMPLEMRNDAAEREKMIVFLEYELGKHLEEARMWRTMCEYDAGETPVPDDLQPWADVCAKAADGLVAAVCKSEKEHGLEPSVPCGGIRSAKSSSPARPRSVLSMQEITERTTQTMSLCFVAEDILDDEDIPADERIQAWRDGFEHEEVTNEELVAKIDAALKDGPSEASKTAILELLSEYLAGQACPELDTLLTPPPA